MRGWLWRLRGILYFAPNARWIAVACLVVYIVMQVANSVNFVNVYGYEYSYGTALTSCFGLNWSLLSQGFLWQPLSYLFLHDGVAHLAFNVLAVLLFGSGLEREVGGRAFWRLFLVCGMVAGGGWLGVVALSEWLSLSWLGGGVGLEEALCIGASGSVFGFIGAYGALFPERVVYMLLPIPMKLRARTLVWVVVVVDLLFSWLLDLRVAVAAHLFGCLAGLIHGRYMRWRREW